MSLTCIAVFFCFFYCRKGVLYKRTIFRVFLLQKKKDLREEMSVVCGLFLLHCFILGVYVSLVTKGMDTCALRAIRALYHIAEAAAST